MTEFEPSQQIGRDGLSAPGGAQQPKLLVIDDDVSICMVIEKLGEKAGFSGKHVVTVEEAKQIVRAEHFDCITLDLSIGKDTGIELLTVLRELGSATPVIIISGSMRSMRDFAVSIGDRMHLAVQEPFAKPIDFARLKQTLVGIRSKTAAQQRIAPAA